MVLAHLGVGFVSLCLDRGIRILSRDKTLVHSPAASGGFPVMAYRCEVCGKEPWVGKQVSFSHKRSSRRWLPNIQRVRVKHGSNSKRIRVCTSCIKAGKIEKA